MSFPKFYNVQHSCRLGRTFTIQQKPSSKYLSTFTLDKVLEWCKINSYRLPKSIQYFSTGAHGNYSTHKKTSLVIVGMFFVKSSSLSHLSYVIYLDKMLQFDSIVYHTYILIISMLFQCHEDSYWWHVTHPILYRN